MRFQHRDKQINPNIAARLVAEVAPFEVEARIVSCDGGGGANGHPKVYINLVSVFAVWLTGMGHALMKICTKYDLHVYM